MARYPKRVRAEKPASGPGLIVGTVRIVQTVLILAGVFYAAILLLSRTEGFRSLVADKLEKIVGMPVQIERSRARVTNLDLEFKGVATENSGQMGQPGLRADRVVVAWSPLASLRNMEFKMDGAEIEGAEIIFATTVTGQWEPAPLAPLSEKVAKWLGMDLRRYVKADAPPAAAAAGPPDKTSTTGKQDMTRLKLRGANVAWWSSETNEIARIDGLALDVTPVDTPGRRLTHYLLKLDGASAVTGFKIRNVNIELVDASDQQVVLTFQADGDTTSASRALDLNR